MTGFMLSLRFGEHAIFCVASTGGEGVGGREYQNQNKSQGINSPLMTGE